jgi:hypothetical protein
LQSQDAPTDPSSQSSLEFMPEPASRRRSSSSPSLLQKILGFLQTKIFSPLRTGLRFLHLVFIFSPVLIASPMLFIGQPEDRYRGERWGAIWWYDLLTRSMQRAGPTFIKVSNKYIHSCFCHNLIYPISWHSGPHLDETCSHWNSATDWAAFIPLQNHTAYATRYLW